MNFELMITHKRSVYQETQTTVEKLSSEFSQQRQTRARTSPVPVSEPAPAVADWQARGGAGTRGRCVFLNYKRRPAGTKAETMSGEVIGHFSV